MNFFDFHVHLPNNTGTKLDFLDRLSGNIIFNDAIDLSFASQINQQLKGNFCFTVLVDFRKSFETIAEMFENFRSLNIRGIKFHSYLQEINESDIDRITKICRLAEDYNLFICLDTSYGTTKMFEYDNLKLAAALVDDIADAPVILLHSGGCRVIEAMLLAEEKNNIFLETSLSIPYYFGSSLEQDFAFVYKKIGCSRVLYGSDYPFTEIENSLGMMLQFLKTHKFSQREIEDIMFNNAMRLINNESNLTY